MCDKQTETPTPGSLKPVGSVNGLKSRVVSAWIEAEDICVDSSKLGFSDSLMVFKARDLLRDVLHVLNANPPNTELSSGGTADKRQQTEQAARRLLK